MATATTATSTKAPETVGASSVQGTINYAEMRTRLFEMKADIEAKKRTAEDRIRSTSQIRTSDAPDASVLDAISVQDIKCVQFYSNELAKIGRALTRLSEGTYGTCLDTECGEEISVCRLNALPHAIYCNNCQEERDTRKEGSR